MCKEPRTVPQQTESKSLRKHGTLGAGETHSGTKPGGWPPGIASPRVRVTPAGNDCSHFLPRIRAGNAPGLEPPLPPEENGKPEQAKQRRRNGVKRGVE